MYLHGEAGNISTGKRSIAKLLGLVGIVFGVVVSAGCKIDSTELDPLTVDTSTVSDASSNSSATSSATSSSSTSTTTSTSSSSDALDLSDVASWYLPSAPSSKTIIAAEVTATINSASTDSKKLYTDYNDYDFADSEGTDAICYFFYKRDGKIVGGKFDYWRSGGQGTKTLENVHSGYGGHSMPSEGTECWTMISSKDGKKRSNTCAVTWK